MTNELFKIIDGGFAQCTPLWNDTPRRRDNCYKLYFCQSGEASVNVAGIWYTLEAGKTYFINGYYLDQNHCNRTMSVYWIHFIPQSLYLNTQLKQVTPVYCWENGWDFLCFFDPTCIAGLFDQPSAMSKHNVLRPSIPLAIQLKVGGTISMLLANLFEQTLTDVQVSDGTYVKLKASIDFMDQHFSQGLTLEEIASKSFLNPAYFQRLFKKTFQITPNDYINAKRLHEACSLLKHTDLSLQTISERLGYCNQFYFSKVFKVHYHQTPSAYRKNVLFS